MFELLSVTFLGKLAEFCLVIAGGVASGWLILRLAVWDNPDDVEWYWIAALFIGVPLGAYYTRNLVFGWLF